MSTKKTPQKVPLWKRLENKKLRVEKLKLELDKLESEEVTVEPKMDDEFWGPKFDQVAAMDNFIKDAVKASFDVKKAEWDKNQKKGKTVADDIEKLKKKLEKQEADLQVLQDAYDKKRAALRAKIVGDVDGRGGIVQSIAMYNYYARELNLPQAHFVCSGEDFEMNELAQQHYEDNDVKFVSIPAKALNKFIKSNKIAAKKFVQTVPVFISEIVGSRNVDYQFAMGQGKQFSFFRFFIFSTFLTSTFFDFFLKFIYRNCGIDVFDCWSYCRQGRSWPRGH